MEPAINTWKETRLGNYFKIKHGFAFKSDYFSSSGQYIVLTPGNFLPKGGLKLKGEKEKYYIGDFPSDYLLHQGEMLVVMTDLTQDAPILGSPAFIPKGDLFLHNQRLGKITDLKENEIQYFSKNSLHHLKHSTYVLAFSLFLIHTSTSNRNISNLNKSSLTTGDPLFRGVKCFF